MSFENLSEVLWSTPGGTGIFGLFDHHLTSNGTRAAAAAAAAVAASHHTSLFHGDLPNNGDGANHNNFVVGISIAVATSFIQSLGLTIQRKSHVLNEAIHPKELRRQACHRPLWHLGFHTYILSNLTGTIFSIGYLPVIILAPLAAVTLVFNALFARLLLGDVFSRQSAAGAITIGLFGVVPEPSHSLEDLIQLYKRPAFIVYFSLIELTVASLLVGNRIVEQVLRHNAKAALSASLSATAGGPPGSTAANHHRVASTASSLNHLSLNRSLQSHRYNKLLGGRRFGKMSPTKIKTLLGVSYGCVSGMLSSQALLFAKSAIELLMLTIIQGKNQFESPLSWFLVIALITAALLQLYYLNKGLRLCDTVLLVPLSFCAYNVSCLFNGLVYYNQWGRLYWWQILLVLFGISQVLIGVLVLAWRPSSSTSSAEDDYYGDEGNESDEATLLLPNSSRPTTPRHSRVFSFKGVSGTGGVGGGGGGGGGPLGSGGHRRQNSSLEARDMIQGFEMYDSDEEELNHTNSTISSALAPSEHGRSLQEQEQQQQQHIRLASGVNSSEDPPPPPIPSPKTLSFAQDNYPRSK
ncbi:hypothetical protein EC968_002438 [Mortierella alpina]|nr:hypothetical protein EC968_002438 [Mortierella alpina]